MSTGNATFSASHTVSSTVPSQTLESPLLELTQGEGGLLEEARMPGHHMPCDFGLSLPLSEFCVLPLPDPLTPTALLTGGKGVCQPGVQA